MSGMLLFTFKACEDYSCRGSQNFSVIPLVRAWFPQNQKLSQWRIFFQFSFRSFFFSTKTFRYEMFWHFLPEMFLSDVEVERNRTGGFKVLKWNFLGISILYHKKTPKSCCGPNLSRSTFLKKQNYLLSKNFFFQSALHTCMFKLKQYLNAGLEQGLRLNLNLEKGSLRKSFHYLCYSCMKWHHYTTCTFWLKADYGVMINCYAVLQSAKHFIITNISVWGWSLLCLIEVI